MDEIDMTALMDDVNAEIDAMSDDERHPPNLRIPIADVKEVLVTPNGWIYCLKDCDDGEAFGIVRGRVTEWGYFNLDEIISLGGPVAESRACRTSLGWIYASHGRTDYAHAEEHVRLGVRLCMGDFQRYEDHTRDLVREHWGTIDRVARALLPAKRLEGDELRRLVEGAS